MRVQVYVPDASANLSAAAAERAEATLQRFGDFIREASLRLRDQNGPRGGQDQECLVRVSLRGAPDVCVRERGDRPMAAVAKALKRVRRAVSERINSRARKGRRDVVRVRPEPDAE